MTADTEPRWVARFRAPIADFPTWNRHAPDRIVLTTTESGRSQLWSWDVATGARHQVTDEEVGVQRGHVTADGTGVVWLSDETGDESGRYLVAPHGGGPARPLAEALPTGWGEGLALGRNVSVAAISDEHGFAIHAIDRDG